MSFKKIAGITGGSFLLLSIFASTLGNSPNNTKQTVVTPTHRVVETSIVQTTTTPTDTDSPLPISTTIPTPKPPVVTATLKPTATAAKSFTPTTTSGGSCKYSCSGPDRDCSDFSSHAEAQVFFNCCEFSARNDPMRLDKANGTGNGVACESL